MAANIEQIFQVFILNKIREIEDQNEDDGPVNALGPGPEATALMAAAEGNRQEVDSGGGDNDARQKKHKKHKKHKSKKRKRKRAKGEKESSSESWAESEGGDKHQPRSTPGDEDKDRDGVGKSRTHKRPSSGKRKKKKKRRKEDERSSTDSDSERENRIKEGNGVGSSGSRHRADLPDIIPKQDSSKKAMREPERGDRRHRSPRSRSRSGSGSRAARRTRRSRSQSGQRSRRSRTRSHSRSRRRRTRSRSKSRSRSRSRSRSARPRRSGSRERRSADRKDPPFDHTPRDTPPLNLEPTGVKEQPTDPRPPEVQAERPEADPPTLPPGFSTPGHEAAKPVGGWKPLPLLVEVSTSSSSSERKEALDGPSKSPPTTVLPDAESDPGKRGPGPCVEDPTEASAESTEKPDKPEDTKISAFQGGRWSSPSPSGPVDPGQSVKPLVSGPLEEAASTSADGSAKSPTKKKEAKSSSKRRRRSKSPSRRYRRSSHSRSPLTRKTSRSRKKSGSRSRKKSGSRSRKKSGSRSRKKSGSRSRKKSRSRSRKKSGSRSRKKSRSRSRSRKKSGSRSRKKSRSRSRKKSGSRSRKKSRSRSRKKSGSKSRKRSRSTSRSQPRRSRSLSGSRGRRRGTYGAFSQRDRWKREPSHSPVLILRKNRSPPRKHRGDSKSPSRITELDKEQLLEIAKANAAAMCAKAGMPIPDNLRPKMAAQLPLNLPLPLPNMAMNAAMASMTAATMTAALSSMGALASLPPLPSITNKPPPGPPQANLAALEEVKRKVAKQANSISIKEFTEKCKMIVDSKGELPVAQPHVSDEEEEGKPFGASALREQRAISFSINNMSVRPSVRSDAGMAKEFPVSSGSQHRKKEGEGAGVYGEWVPVEKTADRAKTAAATAVGKAASASIPMATTQTPATTASPGEMDTVTPTPTVKEPPATAAATTTPPSSDSVFPEPPLQPVDISQAVTERIKAQRRLAENPYDVSAICMLSRAQEQVDAWAQSNSIPGLFTGSTGAQVLSSEELSTSGPQAWLKKDQFLRAAPVSGGMGEFLMRKMGWRTGEGLGRNREGTVEPIVIDFKIDRKGLVAEGEKPQKQTGGLVVTKDLMGKHPVSALIEMCNKKRIMQPEFVMVHHSGPDHRKNFLFKVTVNGVDYQPQTASPNKKHAKAMAATVALQALGEVPSDGPGLYTGPVFTAASTGPLFST